MNLAKAALRHRRCAATLVDGGEEEEAGYIVGLAAECALKHHLQAVKFWDKKGKRLEKDPNYTHFPELRSILTAHGSGILSGRVLTKVTASTFFEGWSIKLRYQHRKSTPKVREQCHRWLQQTDLLFSEVGLS